MPKQERWRYPEPEEGTDLLKLNIAGGKKGWVMSLDVSNILSRNNFIYALLSQIKSSKLFQSRYLLFFLFFQLTSIGDAPFFIIILGFVGCPSPQ